MFFDPKRYDLAPVGRYKYDKKLSVANRVLGQTLSRPAISPVTGEIVFEDGRKITEEDAPASTRFTSVLRTEPRSRCSPT